MPAQSGIGILPPILNDGENPILVFSKRGIHAILKQQLSPDQIGLLSKYKSANQ